MMAAPLELPHMKPAASRASSIQGLGFAPSLQRLRKRLIRIDVAEECGDLHAQHLCKGFQGGDGYVLRAAFDPADIGAVDTGLQCQPFLRKALFDPEAAKVPANDTARVHIGHRATSDA